MAGATGQQNPVALNAAARALIKQRAVDMFQPIYQQSFTQGAVNQNLSQNQPIINVPPRFVGLAKGFLVQLQATIANGSGVQIDLTDWGPANLLSQIQFTDLNNNIRIQTNGQHIHMLNSIKARRPFGTSLVKTTGFDSPINFGNNFAGVISAPATIAAAGSGTVYMWFWIPLAYSNDDLRGSIYLNVLNATAQLSLTVNPTPAVQYHTDSTNAVYVGDVAGSVANAVISAMTVTVYQSYLDQLPTGNGGPILPMLDMATIYELKNTIVNGMVANTDFPIQFSNYRDFLSTVLIYNNNGSYNGRTGGTDLNYLSLQAANFTNLWKKFPSALAIETRNHLQVDPPVGTYYLSSRQKPISTTQFGNQQIILNASAATAGSAYAMVMWEDFAFVQQLAGAGSLAAS